MSGKFEVEMKFALSDPARLEQDIRSRGGEFSAPVPQQDTYYAHPVRSFAETDEALRIRRVGDQAWITYKGPKLDAATKTRREIEIVLQDPPGHAEILSLLGFREVATVAKRRRTARLRFQGRAFEVCWDQVERVGEFVELETSADDETLEDARGAIQQLAAGLGLARSERRSYLELLLGE